MVVSSEVVLRTAGLSKRFGRTVAVDGVDLRVHRGEVFGFLGPNGAGKTTTIALLLGLIHASSGRIEILDEEVRPGRTDVLTRVGSLVGAPGMLPHLSGRENLRLLGRLHDGVDRSRVEEVLEQVGLRGVAERRVSTYSLGMRQRLGLGAAVLHSPALLIMDEPTNGLDPAGMREVRELLRSLAASGITVFLSTHLLNEVEQVCDRVAVLKHGRVIAQGEVADLVGTSDGVRVRVPAPDRAAAILRDCPGVEALAVGADELIVHGLAGEAIIKRLVDRGVVPREVHPAESDLEATFLALTS